MNPFVVRPSRFNLWMINKLSLAHHGPEVSAILPPVNVTTEAPKDLPSTTEAPTTTTMPQMTSTTFKTSTIHPAQTNVSQVNMDIVFLPTAAEMAYTKMLEEIVKSERLEEDNLTRTHHHSSARLPMMRPRPRCSCMAQHHCRSHLSHPKAPEFARWFPGMAKYWKGMVSRNRCDSLDQDESDSIETMTSPAATSVMQLPRSGRGYRGFGFGGCRGGWGGINWGNLGGRNNGNGNTGGFWNRGLPGAGFFLFGNRAGTSTPPRSNSLPDLSTGGLSARLLNLRRSPSAVDLTRPNLAVSSRTPSTATLVDITPNLPSVLPSGNVGSALTRTASQEVASLTGTLPAAPSAALTRTRNELYMPMSSFRPIDPAGAGRSSATGASSSVRASTGGGGTTSTSMEMTRMANRPLPATPDQLVRLSSAAETAIPVGEPIYPSYRDFSSVPPEQMKWHDVVRSKWRQWGVQNPFLQ